MLGQLLRPGAVGAGGAAHRGATLDLDFAHRSATLDATPDRVQAWVDDPASLDHLGRWRASSGRRKPAPVAFASAVTFARASTATGQDANGQLVQMSSNALRAGFSTTEPYTPMGALIEAAAANTVTLNDGTGAVVFNGVPAKLQAVVSGGAVTAINVIDGGSGYIVAPTVSITGVNGGGGSGATATATISGGVVTGVTVNNAGTNYAVAPLVAARSGSLPTGWSTSHFSVVGVGTESGIPYIDVRLRIVAPGGATYSDLFAPCNAALSPPQVWTQSAYVRLLAGSFANITSPVLMCYGTPSYSENNTVSLLGATNAGLATQRFVNTKNFTTANTGLSPRIALTADSTGDIDLTLRIGFMQVEVGSYASSPIITSGTAQTRAGDSLSVQGAAFSAVFGAGRSVTNLVLGSENFDTGWSQTNCTVTPNTTFFTDPAGVNSADLIVPSVTSGSPTILRSGGTAVIGQSYTFSVYARASGYSWIRLSHGYSAGGGIAFFNILSGVMGTVSGGIASMQSVGNSWYRCSLTFTATQVGPIGPQVYVVQGDASYSAFSGDGSNCVGLWGAQYEVAPAVPAPNLIAYPENFVAPWSASPGLTVTHAATNAPDGTLTGTKLVDTVTTAQHLIGYNTGASTIGQVVIASVFAKASERSVLAMTFNGEVAQPRFNLTTGQVIGSPGIPCAISDAGGGWWRCSATFTRTSTNGTFYLAVDDFANRPGNTGQGLHVWGVNVAVGDVMPPYVPLSALCSAPIVTTTSAVTKTGITQGWIVIDALLGQNAGITSQHFATINDGTAGNRLSLYNAGQTGEVRGFATGHALGGFFTAIAGTVTPGTAMRVGMAWSSNPSGGTMIRVSVNGGGPQWAILPWIPLGLSQLQLGGVPGQPTFNGRIRTCFAGANGNISDALLQSATAPGADVRAILG